MNSLKLSYQWFLKSQNTEKQENRKTGDDLVNLNQRLTFGVMTNSNDLTTYFDSILNQIVVVSRNFCFYVFLIFDFYQNLTTNFWSIILSIQFCQNLSRRWERANPEKVITLEDLFCSNEFNEHRKWHNFCCESRNHTET